MFIRSMGCPDCKDIEMLWGKFIFKAPDSALFLEGLRGFGGVDDLKKAEMDKTLRNGLIMSEMDPLNQKW